jgi:hypothetical protein
MAARPTAPQCAVARREGTTLITIAPSSAPSTAATKQAPSSSTVLERRPALDAPRGQHTFIQSTALQLRATAPHIAEVWRPEPPVPLETVSVSPGGEPPPSFPLRCRHGRPACCPTACAQSLEWMVMGTIGNTNRFPSPPK